MLDPVSFDYATIRLVPRVERGEFLNVGVVLFCRTKRFLGCRIHLEENRLAAFSPWIYLEDVREHLVPFTSVCQGGEEAGPIGQLPVAQRFHWLVAPRSTVIQTSPVHSGLCPSPEEALERLFRVLVLPPDSL